MKTKSLYIVPALTDQAGQCRIVSCDGKVSNARDSYRNHPQLWEEVGLMNSRGKLVCLDAPKHVWDEIKDCEPLAAGNQFVIEVDEPVPA